MRSTLKIITMIVIVALWSILLYGCIDKGEDSVASNDEIMYNDILYDILDVNNKLVHEDEVFTNIVTAYSDAERVLTELGASKNVRSVYDENYFTSHDLLVIAFDSNTMYEYTITDIQLNQDILNISINETIPKFVHLVENFRGIFIDVPKGDLSDDVEVFVEINEVIKK